MLGVYPNLSNEEYHDHYSISRSAMMVFNESPYKYWAYYLNHNRPAKASTKAMDFGSAFHTFILESDKFAKEYIVELELEKLPKKLLLKNVGRPAFEANKAERTKLEFINNRLKEEFEEEVENKIVLSFDDFDQLCFMKLALQNHKEAWELIQGAIYEQSYFWKDKESDLLIKARPDILHDNIIVDLKTITCAASKPYQRAMVDSGYHIQGAIIRDGIRELEGRDIPNVINLCIEKTYPFAIGIKIISEQALDEGRIRYKKILMEMKSAIDNNYFPSYEPETIDLPRWY